MPWAGAGGREGALGPCRGPSLLPCPPSPLKPASRAPSCAPPCAPSCEASGAPPEHLQGRLEIRGCRKPAPHTPPPCPHAPSCAPSLAPPSGSPPAHLQGRLEILRVHISCKGLPLGPGVNLPSLAAATTGFTGADLANLVNEAALLAARGGKGGWGWWRWSCVEAALLAARGGEVGGGGAGVVWRPPCWRRRVGTVGGLVWAQWVSGWVDDEPRERGGTAGGPGRERWAGVVALEFYGLLVVGPDVAGIWLGWVDGLPVWVLGWVDGCGQRLRLHAHTAAALRVSPPPLPPCSNGGPLGV